MKMKKNIPIFGILFIVISLFTGCNLLFGKRNSGRVNVSVEIPKEWKHVNKEVLTSYIPDKTTNPFGIIFENVDYKFDGYVQSETAYIIFRQAKIKEIFTDEAKINNLTDFMNRFDMHPDNYTSKLLDMHGTSCLMISTNFGFGQGIAIAIKDGVLYIVDICLIDTGMYNSNAIEESITNTMKFGVNGFLSGISDGIFFLIKWIVHFFNNNVRYFAVANNGVSYIIGFIFGLMTMFGIVGLFSRD